MPHPRPRIELWQATNGRWYFHKVARNGRTTSPSQGYAHRRTARAAARRDIGGLPIIVVVARAGVHSRARR